MIGYVILEDFIGFKVFADIDYVRKVYLNEASAQDALDDLFENHYQKWCETNERHFLNAIKRALENNTLFEAGLREEPTPVPDRAEYFSRESWEETTRPSAHIEQIEIAE